MNDITEDDFFDPSLGDGTDKAAMTRRIEESFKEYLQAEDQNSELSEIMKGNTEKLNKIKNDTLPMLLKEFGSDVWRDPETGIAVELKTAVNSKLPEKQDKRNDIFNALRPIGIEEILGEEFKLNFIPGDKRAKVMRELFGLSVPDHVVEDEDDVEELSEEILEAIRTLRRVAGFDNEGLPAEEKLGVHPSRLKSWLTKQIDAGHGDAIRDAGIWHGKQATFKRPK